eukprot:jgi/Pico_ML_1/50828/g1966.t1
MAEPWAGQKSLQYLRMKELMKALEDAHVRPIAPRSAREGHANGRIQGWEPDKVARRAAFLAFGVFQGTEENPEFLEQAKEVVLQEAETGPSDDRSEKELVLMCLGGTWPRTNPGTDPPGRNGKITRSLQAAYTLVEAGFSRVRVMDGGVRAWYEAGLDMECEEAWSDEWDIGY